MITIMKSIIYLSLFIIFFSCGPASKEEQSQKKADLNKYTNIEDAFNFYVIGDWGRNGEFHQRDLAVTMNKVAATIEPEMILSTGDNFYPDGVISTQDPLWKTSFEDVYTGHGLMAPWYVVLGNHDYHGNPQAEIDYSKISQRWNMPARYFVEDKMIDDGTSIKFIFIDTSPLEDDYYKEEYKQAVSSQDTTRQLRWLDSTLASSKATWNFVVGHHPLYTGGKRVDEPNYTRSHLEKIFVKHNVDVYFAGHEHDLQYIKPEGATHYFVSGSGSEVRPTGKLPISKFAESIQGFMAVSVLKKQMSVQVVDYLGNLIYKITITKKK